MPIFRNDRTGEVVNISASKEDILSSFLKNSEDGDWLWFWLAKHAQRHAVQANTTPSVFRDAMEFISDSFLYAIGRGLKKPMIRLHYQDRRYKIYLSGRGTVCLKSGALSPGTHDPVGDEVYMGCLFQGRFLPNRDRATLPAEQVFMDELTKNPPEFFATCSKDMSRCCYCGLPLEDARSKLVGYGATCATRWGLPWGESTSTEKIPSFADLWSSASSDDRRSIRGLCQEIRRTRQSVLWAILSDAMADAGHPHRLEAPAAGAVIPAV